MSIRVILSGDRNWTDETLPRAVVEQYLHLDPEAVFITGGARGLDTIARLAADAAGVPPHRNPVFRADWNKYHAAAGPIRNRAMLKHGKATHLDVFHHDILLSKGTADMVIAAIEADFEGVTWWRAPDQGPRIIRPGDEVYQALKANAGKRTEEKRAKRAQLKLDLE